MKPDTIPADTCTWVNPADLEVAFDLDTISFGTIKNGEIISIQYSFLNIGQNELAIAVVSACNCMKVEWTRETIAPGARGYVDLLFDSTEYDGVFQKDVDVIFSNTDTKGYPLVKRAVLKGMIERKAIPTSKG